MQERKERITELLKEIEVLCIKAIEEGHDIGHSDLELVTSCCTILFLEEQILGKYKRYSTPSFPDNVVPLRKD